MMRDDRREKSGNRREKRGDRSRLKTNVINSSGALGQEKLLHAQTTQSHLWMITFAANSGKDFFFAGFPWLL